MDEKIVKDSQGLVKDLVNDCISRYGVSAWLANMGYRGLANKVMDGDRFPSVQPEDIQKIQDLEQAQFDKIRELAYQAGKADAMAEIIRCRECRHWYTGDGYNHENGAQCALTHMWMGPDDYCSYGRRKVSE